VGDYYKKRHSPTRSGNPENYLYMNLYAYKHGERDISLPEYLDYPVKPDNDREASNNARYLYLL